MWLSWTAHLPRYAATFHIVGQGDVIGPDVELPLAQPQHAAVNAPRVDTYPHVHVHPHNVPDQPKKWGLY